MIDRANLSKLCDKARSVRTPVLGVLLRHLLFRLRGKKILTSNRVRIQGLRGIETVELLTVGLTDYGFVSRDERTFFNIGGRLEIRGQLAVAKGCRVHVGEQGKLVFHGGYVSPQTTFVIMHGLTVGEDCAISWGCQFLDDDFHALEYEGKVEKDDPAITVGRHVWIGSRVTVLKGAVIPDGCVVAAGAVVTKRFTAKNALLAGNPARVIREDVRWT